MSSSSVSPVSAASRRAIFREVGLLFLGATVLVSVLYRLRSIPLVESNIAVVAAVAFLYLPALLLWRRGRELEDFGLRFRPVGRSLLLWIALTMVVLPPFGYCYELFVHTLCPQYLMKLVVCPTPIAKVLRLPPQLPLLVVSQLLVVALPEEFFFRGYLQQRLSEVMSVQRAWLLQAALFALGHYLVTFHPASLLVFFPGLLFGLLRLSSGSVLAGTLFHATCNLVMETLHRSLG
ncbi:MAG: CPBP family intramembrane metalloprotease [Myxococcales bacterium]|nr:CPBP family intramembrane metalloprotease [Myxococcales bacterium]